MAQTTNPEAVEYGEPPAFAGAQDLTATQFTQDSGSPAILGHVRNLTGEVFLVRRDGTRVRLQEGDQVHQGESVETATGAAAGIELADGSRFALGGETRLALGTDLFDPSVGVGEATYAVLSGTFRFESAGGDGEPVTIVTPDATVTLRDGSIAGQSAGAGQGHWLTLLAGAADVRTRAGSVSLTQAGETTVIAGADAPPTAPFVVSGSDLTAVYGGIAGISDDLAGSLNDIATAAGGDPNDPPPPDPGPATPPPAPLPAAFDTGTPFTAPQFAEAPPEAPAPTAGNDTDPPVAAALPPGDKDPGTDDILIGTADSDVLSGGNGNDTLDGLGESDALFGGPGNDRLVFDPADSVIDGGPGTDTLVVTGDGTILNAATLANVHSIEAIELAGSGNVLSLSADLVRSLSPTGTLTVSAGLGGNALAGVTEGEWRLLGQLAGGDTNFRVFANESDTATLLVEQKVAITDLISREALQTRVDRFSGGNTRIVGEASGDYSGFSVSVAGDVNGDGIDDLIVGARNNHSGGAEDGSAYVVFGSSDRLAEIDLGEIARGTGGFKILGDYNGTAGGSRVSNAGDINGDGLDDIILGVPNSHSSHGDTGAAYVIFGRSDYLAPVRLEEIAEGQGGFRIIGARNLDFAGASVSSAGDFNGDGIGDVILGAFQFDSQFPLEGTDVNVTATNAGAAFIVFGSSDERATIDLRDLVSESNGIVLASETPSARAARSVSRAGDINGDGLDDVIVSVRNSGSPDGGAFVVFGTVAPTSGASLEEIAAGEKGSRIIPEPSNGAESDVSFAGDVNGDGIDDLIVGAYRSDANGTDSGVAYVVFGSREGFPSSVDLSDVASGTGGFKIIGEYSGDQAGISVAAAGDINGDGIDDLIIGANRNNAGGASAGAAYIVLGSTIFDATIDLHDIAGGSGGFKLLGTGLAGRLGESVSSAGDFDGDGIDDVIIGAPGLRTNGTVKSGGAFILYGFDQAVTEQITALGTSGDDTFAGTVSKDVIAGSLGDDTIFGNGGADVLLGGAGNDFFQVPSTDFAKIDGGIGVDRLHLEGGDLSFNLTSPDSPQLSGIVQIDLTGPGNISVTLTALEASSISDTGTLTIAGDTGDTVAALDLWNRLDDVDIEGQAHYHFEEPTGTTTLFIDQDITLEGLLSTRVASEAIDSFAGGGFKIIGEDDGDEAGRAVSDAGDVNGDGIDDIIIGAHQNSVVGGSNGAAYVVFGNGNPFESIDLGDIANGSGGFKILGEGFIDAAGTSVSAAGDVNGDGLDDVIVGTARHFISYNGSSLEDQIGAAYVVFGRTSGPASVLLTDVAQGTGGFRIIGDRDYDILSSRVSGAGDINGDGFDDIAVSGLGNFQYGHFTGSTYLIFGTDASLTTIRLGDPDSGSQGFRILGEAAGDHFGAAIAAAGDFNADGFDDLLISADGNNAGGAGAAYVVFGSTSPFPDIDLGDIANGTGGFKIVGESQFNRIGDSLDSAGDVNGDGIDDIVIGAGVDSTNGYLSGGAYVIFGTTEDVSNLDLNLVAAGTGGFKIVGMSPYDRAGNEVSSAGDINGDGFDDIIVATYDDDSDVAYVIFGTNQPHAIVDLTAVSAGIGGFKISSANIGDNSGVSVSRAGDLNNDGFDDLLIGASKDSDGGHHSGAAYVLFGFDTDSYERPPGSEGIFGPVIPDPGSGSGGTGGIIVIIGSSGSTMSFGSTDFSVQLPLAAAQSPEMESAAETQNDPGEGYNLFANTADGVTLGTDTAAVMG